MWPDISFGPVNLWILPQAWWFYLSEEEKERILENRYREEEEW